MCHRLIKKKKKIRIREDLIGWIIFFLYNTAFPSWAWASFFIWRLPHRVNYYWPSCPISSASSAAHCLHHCANCWPCDHDALARKVTQECETCIPVIPVSLFFPSNVTDFLRKVLSNFLAATHCAPFWPHADKMEGRWHEKRREGRALDSQKTDIYVNMYIVVSLGKFGHNAQQCTRHRIIDDRIEKYDAYVVVSSK